MINEQDIATFEKYEDLYTCLKKNGFIRNYSKETYTDLLNLYTTYVNPKHSFSHWCSSCRAELVHYLYAWYEVNKVTLSEPIAEDVPQGTIEEVIIQPKKTRKRK